MPGPEQSPDASSVCVWRREAPTFIISGRPLTSVYISNPLFSETPRFF